MAEPRTRRRGPLVPGVTYPPCPECGGAITVPWHRMDGTERAYCSQGCAEGYERDECRTCGQQVLGERDASGAFRCFHCLEAARAPQGSQERLFEPVAAPMRGQVRIVDIDDRLAEMQAQLERMQR